MKRLLAYLFIVVCLGLTFNVKVEATIKIVTDETYSYFKHTPDKIYIYLCKGNSTFYVYLSDYLKNTHSYLNDGKCYYYEQNLISLKQFNANKGKVANIKRDKSFLVATDQSFLIETKDFKPIDLYEDNNGIYVLAKDLLGELDFYLKKKSSKKQIAKAEPSQTHEVAKKNTSTDFIYLKPSDVINFGFRIEIADLEILFLDDGKCKVDISLSYIFENYSQINNCFWTRVEDDEKISVEYDFYGVKRKYIFFKDNVNNVGDMLAYKPPQNRAYKIYPIDKTLPMKLALKYNVTSFIGNNKNKKVVNLENKKNELEKILINYCVKVDKRYDFNHPFLVNLQEDGFMFPILFKKNRCPGGYVIKQDPNFYFQFVKYYKNNSIFLPKDKLFTDPESYGEPGIDKKMALPTICYNRYTEKLFVVDKLDRNCSKLKSDFNYEITFDGDSFYINKNRTQIAGNEKIVIPKKKAKVVKKEPKQEEFKPKKTNQDNIKPVINIKSEYTFKDAAYTFKGKVKDKGGSEKLYLFSKKGDSKRKLVTTDKKGKFEITGFSLESEEITLIAIDSSNNVTEKIVKVIIDIEEETEIAKVYDQLKPIKKGKKDNNRVAIIIGVESYEKSSKALYADNDAKMFKYFATKALGISSANIKLLVDNEAKRLDTIEALKAWLPKKILKNKSELFVFFSGHGYPSNDNNLYLIPQNGDPRFLEESALSKNYIIEQIQKLQPKSVTMFFDACYSGNGKDGEVLVAGLKPIRLLEIKEDIPENFYIFSSSDYNQESSTIKEAEHGIFSYYLMKGLEGNADENKDKKITNGELIAYLKDNVSQEAFTQNREQDPSLAGDPDKILMSYR